MKEFGKIVTVCMVGILFVGSVVYYGPGIVANLRGGEVTPGVATATVAGQVVTVTRTATAPPTTTTPTCPEAPAILSIPLSQVNNGPHYGTSVNGDMGVYKGSSVDFDHFGTVIHSTAIIYNHFTVEIVDYTGMVDWASISIYVDIWGCVGEGDDWREIVSATEADLFLAMPNPWTCVFSYELELNYYTMLSFLGGIVYGDGTTDTMYLDMAIYVDLWDLSGNWMEGGDWLYFGMKIDLFEYCVDSSGIYDCNVEYWEWDEW